MEQVIPKGLFITCVILVGMSFSGMITGKLQWWRTNQESTLLVLGLVSFVILIINSLIKKKKK